MERRRPHAGPDPRVVGPGDPLPRAGRQPRLFEPDASAPTFSPDGRFIAYASPASGIRNVFVRSTRGEGKWQVSSEPGGDPKWSGDGRELFYLTALGGSGSDP